MLWNKFMDSWYVGAATIAATALALGLAAAFGRKATTTTTTPSEAAAAEEPAASSSSPKKKSKKKSSSNSEPAEPRSTTRSATRTAAEEKLNNRTPLPVGAKCWHRQSQQDCEVVKVYYDDPPPYYQVKFADGSERSTIRSRLDSAEEHSADIKDAELQQAEARAEAAAAELLAMEDSKRPASSGGRGDRNKKASKAKK